MNKFFLFSSFLPAIAYWYLEQYYPIRVAVIGGIGLAILEVLLEYLFTKHVHQLSIVNFVLMVILGGLSLMAQRGIWFKLTPFFTGLVMGGVLLFYSLNGKGLLLPMMLEMNPQIKNSPIIPLIGILEKHLGVFLICYGSFMALLALKFSTGIWVFFKTIGFYVALFVFFIAEGLYIRFLK